MNKEPAQDAAVTNEITNTVKTYLNTALTNYMENSSSTYNRTINKISIKQPKGGCTDGKVSVMDTERNIVVSESYPDKKRVFHCIGGGEEDWTHALQPALLVVRFPFFHIIVCVVVVVRFPF